MPIKSSGSSPGTAPPMYGAQQLRTIGAQSFASLVREGDGTRRERCVPSYRMAPSLRGLLKMLASKVSYHYGLYRDQHANSAARLRQTRLSAAAHCAGALA
jgi:hypothetical protein